MATLKIETINLTDMMVAGQSLTIKLDAWKQTFYYWTLSRNDSNVLINNLPLARFAHDHDIAPSGNHGNGPLVIEFGGAHYKGRPIQIDDTITFYCKSRGEEPNNQFALLMVKQYFVEDRPGPDRQIGDRDIDAPALPRKAVARAPRPVVPSRPVIIERKPTRSR